MGKRRPQVTAIKASEAVVARMLGRHLGVGPLDTIDEITTALAESPEDSPLHRLVQSVEGLYAWMTPVAADIMSQGTTTLTEHLMSLPGHVCLVRDSERSGIASLWLVVADPPHELRETARSVVCRGLWNTFMVGGSTSQVIAIQLSSCQI